MPDCPKHSTCPDGRNVLDYLIDTATAEFAKYGFEGVSMGEIARKCGVTKAALYYYFASKESLYGEVCNRKLEDIEQLVSNAVNQETQPIPQLEAFVRTLYDCLTKESTTMLLSLRDIMSPLISSQVREPSSHFKFFMEGLLRRLSRDGAVFNHEELSLSVAALIFGYCSLSTFDVLKADVEREALRTFKREQMLENIKILINAQPTKQI